MPIFRQQPSSPVIILVTGAAVAVVVVLLEQGGQRLVTECPWSMVGGSQDKREPKRRRRRGRLLLRPVGGRAHRGVIVNIPAIASSLSSHPQRCRVIVDAPAVAASGCCHHCTRRCGVVVVAPAASWRHRHHTHSCSVAALLSFRMDGRSPCHASTEILGSRRRRRRHVVNVQIHSVASANPRQLENDLRPSSTTTEPTGGWSMQRRRELTRRLATTWAGVEGNLGGRMVGCVAVPDAGAGSDGGAGGGTHGGVVDVGAGGVSVATSTTMLIGIGNPAPAITASSLQLRRWWGLCAAAVVAAVSCSKRNHGVMLASQVAAPAFARHPRRLVVLTALAALAAPILGVVRWPCWTLVHWGWRRLLTALLIVSKRQQPSSSYQNGGCRIKSAGPRRVEGLQKRKRLNPKPYVVKYAPSSQSQSTNEAGASIGWRGGCSRHGRDIGICMAGVAQARVVVCGLAESEASDRLCREVREVEEARDWSRTYGRDLARWWASFTRLNVVLAGGGEAGCRMCGFLWLRFRLAYGFEDRSKDGVRPAHPSNEPALAADDVRIECEIERGVEEVHEGFGRAEMRIGIEGFSERRGTSGQWPNTAAAAAAGGGGGAARKEQQGRCWQYLGAFEVGRGKGEAKERRERGARYSGEPACPSPTIGMWAGLEDNMLMSHDGSSLPSHITSKPDGPEHDHTEEEGCEEDKMGSACHQGHKGHQNTGCTFVVVWRLKRKEIEIEDILCGNRWYDGWLVTKRGRTSQQVSWVQGINATPFGVQLHGQWPRLLPVSRNHSHRKAHTVAWRTADGTEVRYAFGLEATTLPSFDHQAPWITTCGLINTMNWGMGHERGRQWWHGKYQ
ncbi:hypothetical protein BDZ97DRAFT_2005835 [Flammula alnicola]|nr:hypothetical protein BDZ97DRAFT_2005835 [Flammula alnicola]